MELWTVWLKRCANVIHTMWCIYVRFDNVAASFPILNIHTGLWHYFPSSLPDDDVDIVSGTPHNHFELYPHEYYLHHRYPHTLFQKKWKTTFWRQRNRVATVRFARHTRSELPYYNCLSILLLLLLSPVLSLAPPLTLSFTQWNCPDVHYPTCVDYFFFSAFHHSYGNTHRRSEWALNSVFVCTLTTKSIERTHVYTLSFSVISLSLYLTQTLSWKSRAQNRTVKSFHSVFFPTFDVGKCNQTRTFSVQIHGQFDNNIKN